MLFQVAIMSSCYSCEQLARFLDGELSLEEQQILEAHVEACDLCLKSLKHLVGPDHSFVGIALSQTVGKPGPELDPDYLESLKQVPPTYPTVADEAAAPSWPTIPGYEIWAHLGRGGMSTVYRARHLGLKRD